MSIPNLLGPDSIPLELGFLKQWNLRKILIFEVDTRNRQLYSPFWSIILRQNYIVVLAEP